MNQKPKEPRKKVKKMRMASSVNEIWGHRGYGEQGTSSKPTGPSILKYSEGQIHSLL